MKLKKSISSYWHRFKVYRHTDYGLLFIAAFLGIVIGAAIVLFHLSMGLAEEFFGSVFFSTDEYLHIGRFALPFVTALGGLLVGVLNTKLFAQIPTENLHTIVHAIERYHGRVHWGHAVRSISTAALSIASGGGGGREAPTIMLGSSLGSTIGQASRLNENALKILCAAGASAAISGIFNAPLAGIIFSLEAIIGGITLSLFVPVVISSVLSTAISRILLGTRAEIIAPSFSSPALWEYAIIAVVGVLCGLVAIYFIQMYRATSLRITRWLLPLPPMFRPALGGFVVGIMAAALPTLMETSYSPVNLAIAGNITLLVAGVTVLLKPVNNAITLASGGAGGTFAPSLKVGAMFGAMVAMGLGFLMDDVNVSLYAVIGSAAILAGSWRIPLTAAVLLCEISNNYAFLLPLLLATVVAVFVVERVKAIETFNPLDREVKSLRNNKER